MNGKQFAVAVAVALLAGNSLADAAEMAFGGKGGGDRRLALCAREQAGDVQMATSSRSTLWYTPPPSV